MPDDLRAMIVLHLPAQRISLIGGCHVFQALAGRGNRHRGYRLPHFTAGFLAEQSVAFWCRSVGQLDLQPARHVIGAHRDHAGGRGRAAQLVAFVEQLLVTQTAHHAADASVRIGAVGVAEMCRIGGGTAFQASGRKHMVVHIVFPAFSADLLDQLPGNRVEDIVIGIFAAKAGIGLDITQAPNQFLARYVAARNIEQVACPERQTAAMDQQITHRHFAGYPGIVHLEPGHVIDDRVIPADLAGVDQRRQGSAGKGLAGRADHEDRIGIDLGIGANLANAIAFGERDFAIFHNGDRYTGRSCILADLFDMIVEIGRRRGERRQRCCAGRNRNRGEQDGTKIKHGKAPGLKERKGHCPGAVARYRRSAGE